MTEPVKPTEQVARLFAEVDREIEAAVAVANAEQAPPPASVESEQPPLDPVRRQVWRL